MPQPAEDHTPKAGELIPEEIAALRVELMEERRRHGVQPYTPERAAKARAAFFYPPLSDEEIDAYDAAIERRRES